MKHTLVRIIRCNVLVDVIGESQVFVHVPEVLVCGVGNDGERLVRLPFQYHAIVKFETKAKNARKKEK
jgi:hypothetical protein